MGIITLHFNYAKGNYLKVVLFLLSPPTLLLLSIHCGLFGEKHDNLVKHIAYEDKPKLHLGWDNHKSKFW